MAPYSRVGATTTLLSGVPLSHCYKTTPRIPYLYRATTSGWGTLRTQHRRGDACGSTLIRQNLRLTAALGTGKYRNLS